MLLLLIAHPAEDPVVQWIGHTLSNHPLQDACEALEWDCRLESCRGRLLRHALL